jgi:hypothetical protein
MLNNPFRLLSLCTSWGALLFCAKMSAQCSLSCNDDLNISLNQNGAALITAAMMAPTAPSSCPGTLEITLSNALGQSVPNPVGCGYVGQTLTAKVRHLSSGNFCTGTVNIFDAIAPTLTCNNKFIFCIEEPNPILTGQPVVTDNCTPSGDISLSYVDETFNLSCDSFVNGIRVLSRVQRTWTATDAAGNNNSCVQQIWAKHIGQNDLVFPQNLDNISRPSLNCGQDPDDLDLTGQPTVNGVMITNSPACEIAVSYTDQTLQICPPAGKTVIRSWIAVDAQERFLARFKSSKLRTKTPLI